MQSLPIAVTKLLPHKKLPARNSRIMLPRQPNPRTACKKSSTNKIPITKLFVLVPAFLYVISLFQIFYKDTPSHHQIPKRMITPHHINKVYCASRAEPIGSTLLAGVPLSFMRSKSEYPLPRLLERTSPAFPETVRTNHTTSSHISQHPCT